MGFVTSLTEGILAPLIKMVCLSNKTKCALKKRHDRFLGKKKSFEKIAFLIFRGLRTSFSRNFKLNLWGKRAKLENYFDR
ncbi:MAG: hypothetical protein CMQ53_04905 [Gammaproteobacteria bacterium]|nr:hypothetical protein [Gammaproteobacteria bacterium]